MRTSAALVVVLAPVLAILVVGPGVRAEPTAIIACQTISQPGSYRLANNLTG